jgi:hypothetical protein
MAITIKWKSLASGTGASKRLWSGPHVSGNTVFEAPLDPASHAHRAVWLSSQLEAPSWGSVQGYDGCGMSAGLLHNTAVLPNAGKPVQGKLWSLIDAMHKHPSATNAPGISALMARITACGWEIAPHGALVAAGTLKPVAAAAILRELTPPDGAVPERGSPWKKASDWAVLFHEAFAEAATFSAQVAHAADWLSADRRGEEHRVYALFAPNAAAFMDLRADALPAEIDLAMCIYHAFSVHNPLHAREALALVLQSVDGGAPLKFAKALVRTLANKTPRWQTKRYPRTRETLRKQAAQALWPSALIASVAPAQP